MFWNFLKKSAAKPKTGTVSSTNSSISIALPLEFLQKLIPIGDLPVDELHALKVTSRHFAPGDIIFNRGDSADELIYLRTGEVFLETVNGSGYNVDATTFKACYPLSANIEHCFSAIAKSTTEIIYLPLSMLQRSSTAAYVNNPLITPKDIPSILRSSHFFNGCCGVYRKDQLHVPSLPDVALRLRSALQKDIDIADAVKIINLDPVISSKLIQVVNSPFYRTFNPITNSHDAVNRLGLKTTQNLVTSISMNNLFRSNNKQLNKRIQQLWQQSIQIASLSYTLASFSHKINPDEALLAGLVHNIGALPIVTYAESQAESDYTEQELEQTIATLHSRIGVYILKKWRFPESLQQIPAQVSNWYHDENPELQLSDIVLLARFHSQFGSTHSHHLPPLHTLPAFLKLGDNALTPDMSLQVLHDAKEQIARALDFFRA